MKRFAVPFFKLRPTAISVRRLSTKPFPAYTYIPGKTPHPVSDPAGHSYQQRDPKVREFSPINWRFCEEYLYGIDLFVAGFFWEAHVEWEAVWHAVGKRGHLADFVKGLIKLAAAGVKALEGSEVGVLRHSRRAAELFRLATSGQHASASMCGFDVEGLIRGVVEIVERSDARAVEGHLRNVVKSSLKLPSDDI